MSFLRTFSETQKTKMTSGNNAELFAKLRVDVLKGDVFPAVRQNELHFYYKGGCLFKFANGAFRRDKNFEKFGVGLEELPPYERAKKENERKFTRVSGKIMERQLLDALNRHTFDFGYEGSVVVLDIEVDLNGTVGRGKKCDMVLMNRLTDELMFVEGKVFSDSRVLVSIPFTPEVIAQVNTYTAAIEEQRQNILEHYARHIEVINELFGTAYRSPKKLAESAKLLVYSTPTNPTKNGVYSIDKINTELGAHNVLWLKPDDNPALDEIWKYYANNR